MSKEDQKMEQMRHDFKFQLEKLKAKEEIIVTSVDEVWKQPGFRGERVKDLFYGVVRARRIREEDLKNL
jgi:hypothetical protein